MDSLYKKGYLERKCWGKQMVCRVSQKRKFMCENMSIHICICIKYEGENIQGVQWGPKEPLQPSPLTTHNGILCSPHRADLLSSAPPISSPLFTSSSWPGILYCDSFCILVSFKIQLKFHDLSQALPDKSSPECLFLPLSSYTHCPSFIRK